MSEQLARAVQVRVNRVQRGGAVEFGVRVPLRAIEASALDPEGIAQEVARVWAKLLREELNIPVASGAVSLPRATDFSAVQR